MMKKKKTAAIALLTTIAMCSAFTFAACGSSSIGAAGMDNLGGGGTATTPTEVTDSTLSDVTSNTTDISSSKTDTDSSSASALDATEETLEITAAGDYTLTGSYPAGIKIKKDLGDVHLFLNNATISSSTGIAIESKSGNDVTITLTGENTVTNSVAADAEDGENAIHVKGDLTINGDGTLNVTSSSKAAIKAKGSLKIASATIVAEAAANAIAAESVDALDAKITVTAAEKDGVHAECDFDNSDGDTSYGFTYDKGYISFNNVEFTASCKGDGLQADTYVCIEGGKCDITTTGEFVTNTTANKTTYGLDDDDFKYRKSGSSYARVDSESKGSYALAQSCKGIKVGLISYDSVTGGDGEDDTEVSSASYAIILNGGEYEINSADDAIHANGGDVVVNDGTFVINTLDDGITADNLTHVAGGDITIESCYEGLEGAYVTIEGDNKVDVTASDDGINAASDDDDISEYVIIHDGDITVNADGDGIDSNGSILIDGGNVTVFGPTNGGNAGLDSETGILINGGNVFVTSALGMVETPSTNSTQYVLALAATSTISANATITVKNSDGDTLFTTTTAKSCQSLIVSLPDIEKGETYTIYSGSSQLGTFSVSSIISSYGSISGSTGGNGMSGGNNNGGEMNNGGGMGGGNRR